ncbi:hypothetical protein J3R30DRAFT_3588632 [Lentinula aciculospora]|uniref:Sacsin/Nov domain-containing protein n=1 Tax=Lentinula aciculospora TaxID=153920 RepID=A0A9W9DEA5_9AGAR|nr:hypothetical protein J3R30DRAFT_3588632 [Lentinula aciculospora]
MPTSWEERVDTASAIKGILDSYPSNSILREILQNSDDAGATKQIFILDHRQHGTETVVETALERTQGPALLALNDSIFTESDWEAVRTIHGSNKTADETKTGKYGLGIRACYHVTDNIHILSGKQLVIFDPHREFKSFSGGLSITLDEIANYKDQISAFSGAVPEIPSYLNATVLRLPLRTSAEAQRSRFKPLAVTISDIQALFQSFVRNELSVALLFLKNILSIELREITPDGKNALIAEVAVSNQDVASVRQFMLGHDDCVTNYKLDISTVSGGSSVTQSWRIIHVVISEGSVKAKMEDCLGYDVGESLRDDKLLPHVALAFPLSHQDIQGRLFTLLPLPILTGFPLHVNGIFALTPDRQSLRNTEELGIGLESRERRLVAWNQMLFEDLLPRAWTGSLFDILIREDHIENIWSAWPPEHDLITHARSMLAHVTQKSLGVDRDIFPALSGGEPIFLEPSCTALVAAESIDRELIKAVAKTGIAIITPPEYIFSALQGVGLKGHGFKSFGAKNLHSLLSLPSNQLQTLEAKDKHHILEYLICASTDYIVGLSLIPTVGGDYIFLSKPTPRSTRYTLAAVIEVELFSSCDKGMIKLSSLPEKAREKLEQCCDGKKLNVARLEPINMKTYLVKILGDSTEEQSPLPSSLDLSWFSSFWTWIDSLCNSDEFLKVASSFHLLPMLDANIFRRVLNRAFLYSEDQAELCRELAVVGIPFLHPTITSTKSLSTSGFTLSIYAFSKLMSFVDVKKSSGVTDRLILHDHFIRCIELQKSVLNSKQRKRFRSLPVFPVRVPKVPSPETELKSAMGILRFINVTDDFPLPCVENVTYIDMSKSSRILGLLLDSNASAETLGEVKVMELAIQNLSKQPEVFQDVLMRKIVPRLFDLPGESRETLRHQRFIPVDGSQERVSPVGIIDPESPLASLFEGEKGRFPMRPYSDHIFLSIMRTAGFYSVKLSHSMLQERIQYISSVPSDPVRVEKAKSLLHLLSNQWNSSFTQIVQSTEQTTWIPTTSNTLVSRQRCRQGEHHFLFDFVLCTVPCAVSDEVRNALGWTSLLKFDILEQQLQATLQRPDSDIPDRVKRLSHLIVYLSKQHSTGNLTSANISSLRTLVQHYRWIPVSLDKVMYSQNALLTPDMKIGDMFQSIFTTLQNRTCISFLKAMGCNERPTINILIDALTGSIRLDERIALLSELSQHAGSITGHQRDSILAPDYTSTSRKLSEVYSNDIGEQNAYIAPNSSLFALHPDITTMVASKLGVPSLSSLRLEEQDDIEVDEEDMSETLITRIKKLLVEYDIQYSFNEFLANAVDAGASRFDVLLDAMPFVSTQILCREMSVFQQGPAVVLYNDAVFSEDDFKGIRKIGEGGKQERIGTIGKFGLGALSFYHFSDLAVIISKQDILILDPLASHLPKRRGQKRRSMWSKLKVFRSLYSGHLLPFDGLFGFSLDMDSYPGTLIRLPLRTKAGKNSPIQLSNVALTLYDCRKLIMGPYQGLSQTAVFFTPLKRINAQERLNGRLTLLWAVEKLVQNTVFHGKTTEDLILTHRTTEFESQQRWLVIRDSVSLAEIPPSFSSVIHQLKAMHGVDISMAFHVDEPRTDPEAQYYLFCGLQLPVAHSLPAHINAPFAISSDRRSIRFDPPDSNGRRVPQSDYNAWLLSHPIATLYLYGLQNLFLILHHKPSFTNWWPKKAKQPISEEILRAFYASLPTSNVAIFPTATDELIAPRNAIIADKEPSLVRELLTRLKVPNYVKFHLADESIRSHLPKELPMLDVQALSDILKKPTAEKRLRELFRHDLAFLAVSGDHESRSKVIAMIDATLNFLLRGRSSSCDLLLLVTNDLGLRHFNATTSKTYRFLRSFPEELFPNSQILCGSLSPQTQEMLAESSLYGVQNFDITAVLSFLQKRVGSPRDTAYHSSDCTKWIALFWQTFELGQFTTIGLELKDLNAYPLFPIFEDNEFISLRKCLSGDVLPDPKSTDLRNIMHTLGIPVLQDHTALPTDNDHLKFSFMNFLDCLLRRGGDPFAELDPNQFDWLAIWIVKEMRYGLGKMKNTHLTLLAGLPLWKSIRNGTIQQLSADELCQLPSDVELSRIGRFLDPNRSIAEYTIQLQDLWSALRDRCGRANPSYRLAQLLLLPDFLREDDIPDYKYLLGILSRDNGAFNFRVPDGQLRLRFPRELYSSNSEIFMGAFHYSQDKMFLHPDFRELEQDFGVKKVVTFKDFQQCAQAIDNDQRCGRDDGIIARALTIYEYYNRQLPSQIMTNSRLWEALDDIRFIPRGDTSSGASYNAAQTRYAVNLHPPVVSPRELLRDEYQPIAWTQRANFLITPTPDLIAVYTNVGQPTTRNVVDHLVVLATQVSREYVHDQGFICDLKATYDWLHKNRPSAGIELKKHQDEQIFLNVHSINAYSEAWEWRSANELILDLYYDSQKCFRVQSFLSEFRELLVSAGVRKRVDVTFADETRFGDPKFEKLRVSRKLLNIKLRPEYSQEDEILDPERLKAHAVFLAANVPHFEEALTGGWNEETSDQFPFPGTYFGACAFLDLLYTGDILEERPHVDEDAMNLLENLLEMLQIADMWDLPALKMKLGWLITSKYRFIQPETLEMIRDEAAKYHAPELAKACDDFAEKNAEILPDLKDLEEDLEEWMDFEYMN